VHINSFHTPLLVGYYIGIWNEMGNCVASCFFKYLMIMSFTTKSCVRRCLFLICIYYHTFPSCL
jgi:hypothetical protein